MEAGKEDYVGVKSRQFLSYSLCVCSNPPVGCEALVTFFAFVNSLSISVSHPFLRL